MSVASHESRRACAEIEPSVACGCAGARTHDPSNRCLFYLLAEPRFAPPPPTIGARGVHILGVTDISPAINAG
ncbi:MAG: hypothetical protein ACE5I2_02385 [Anaerolineae bacterium]